MPAPALRGRYPVADAVRCIGCGCTNLRACAGGCSWFRIEPPSCSACVVNGRLCADAADSRHVPVYLTATTGYCDVCRHPFVANEAFA